MRLIVHELTLLWMVVRLLAIPAVRQPRIAKNWVHYPSLLDMAITLAVSEVTKFWKPSSELGSLYCPFRPSSVSESRKQAASYSLSRTNFVSRIS